MSRSLVLTSRLRTKTGGRSQTSFCWKSLPCFGSMLNAATLLDQESQSTSWLMSFWLRSGFELDQNVGVLFAIQLAPIGNSNRPVHSQLWPPCATKQRWFIRL